MIPTGFERAQSLSRRAHALGARVKASRIDSEDPGSQDWHAEKNVFRGRKIIYFSALPSPQLMRSGLHILHHILGGAPHRRRLERRAVLLLGARRWGPRRTVPRIHAESRDKAVQASFRTRYASPCRPDSVQVPRVIDESRGEGFRVLLRIRCR